MLEYLSKELEARLVYGACGTIKFWTKALLQTFDCWLIGICKLNVYALDMILGFTS